MSLTSELRAGPLADWFAATFPDPTRIAPGSPRSWPGADRSAHPGGSRAGTGPRWATRSVNASASP